LYPGTQWLTEFNAGFNTMDLPLILLAAFALFGSLTLQELLHAFGIALFNKNNFKSEIIFGYNSLNPTHYCVARNPQKLVPYIIERLLPLFLLGVIPYVISMLIGNQLVCCISLINIFFSGHDIVRSAVAIKSHSQLILDDPIQNQIGFIALYKE
jgi:hypothetical protein